MDSVTCLIPSLVVFLFCIPHNSRIKAERESRIKAMEARAKRGVSRIGCIALSWIKLGCVPTVVERRGESHSRCREGEGKRWGLFDHVDIAFHLPPSNDTPFSSLSATCLLFQPSVIVNPSTLGSSRLCHLLEICASVRVASTGTIASCLEPAITSVVQGFAWSGPTPLFFRGPQGCHQTASITSAYVPRERHRSAVDKSWSGGGS